MKSLTASALALAACVFSIPTDGASSGNYNAARCFPPGFLFGTATASHQVEGAWNVDGKTPNIWDAACRERPLEVACANVADDFFHRFREDVQLMVRDGHSSFRFSISWSRVMTWNKTEKRMTPNDAGLAFYHSLLDELLQNGIEPVLTMHHWDLPVEFATELRKLGWLDRDMVDHFLQLTELLYLEFGGKVRLWTTFNEPLTFVALGYALGIHPPYLSGELDAYTAAHNVLLAHGVAVQRFRQLKSDGVVRPDARISIALNYDNAYPLNASDPSDVAAAERKQAFDYGWWAEPLTKGEYPAIMRERAGALLPQFTDTEAALLRGSYDLIMFNHYNSMMVTDCSSPLAKTACEKLPAGWARDKGVDDTQHPEGARRAGDGNPKCAIFNSYPKGYRDTLRIVHSYDPSAEILLTENGWCGNATIDNRDQLWHFQTHLEQVYGAMQEDGIPIIGYTAWALVDNYEWGSYEPRFGLYYVNFTANVGAVDEQTPDVNDKSVLQRIPRTAATWYAQTATSKCLTGDWTA